MFFSGLLNALKTWESLSFFEHLGFCVKNNDLKLNLLDLKSI